MVDEHGIYPFPTNSDGCSAWSFHHIWGTQLQVPKRRATRATGLSMKNSCHVTCKDPDTFCQQHLHKFHLRYSCYFLFMFIFLLPLFCPSSEQLELIRWLIYQHTCFAEQTQAQQPPHMLFECDSLWQEPCRQRTLETSSSKKAFVNAFCASR